LTERTRRRRRRSSAPARPRPALTAAVVAGGIVLAGLSVFQGLAQTGVLTDTADAVSAQAWGLLGKGADAGDRRAAEALAKQALRRDPFQSRSLALMAALRQDAGDKAGALRLMTAASALDHRNDVVDYWFLNHSIETRQYDMAAHYADALLRREVETLGPQVFPSLLAAMNDRSMMDAVSKRLTARPRWRMPFLLFASSRVQDPFALFPIYSAMKGAGAPPTNQELGTYFQRLIAAKRFDEAYLSWVLFLPDDIVAKLDNIYDGDFESWPETPPFGWALGGVRASIEPSSGYGRDGSALRVDYEGVGLPKLPNQLLLLTPGEYRFTGLELTANPESADRMEWSLTCDGTASLLPSRPIHDTKGQWKAFSAVFRVPDGCKGQVLELKPIPGSQRQSVEVWFDHLSIRRVDAAPEVAG
jgi:hypothetical protein